jgi:hypothetical protein
MNSNNLYQLTTEYQNLLPQLYNPETGEVNEEIDAQINALSLTTEKKCIAVASWIKSMESEKKQIEYIKQQIQEREEAYDKAIMKTTDYLESNMNRIGIKEVKCPLFTIKIKTNPHSTEICDQSSIPNKFINIKTKTELSVDKKAIKEEVLKTGVQVPGAFVYQKTKLEIITDKL